MTRKQSVGQIRSDLDKAKRQAKFYEDQLKAKSHELTTLNRKARTHRLCSHGAMLEKFLEKPELLTDEEIMVLLALAFQRTEVQDRLKTMLSEAERRSPEGP
jgi:hypothetical protein